MPCSRVSRQAGRRLALTAVLGSLMVLSPSCRPPARSVTVAGTDYAFEAPDTLSGGRTAISFQNRGRRL